MKRKELVRFSQEHNPSIRYKIDYIKCQCKSERIYKLPNNTLSFKQLVKYLKKNKIIESIRQYRQFCRKINYINSCLIQGNKASIWYDMFEISLSQKSKYPKI